MPLVTTEAVVLQAYPYSETSKILRLLTPDHGVCSVLARGAQRPRSRFGGVLEPFTEGSAQIYLREGRDLHTLGGFDLGRSRQAIGGDLLVFAGASLLAELVIRSATAEPQPALYSLLITALDRVVDAPAELRREAVVADVWMIVSALGYRPEVDACVGCGAVVDPDADTRFDIDGGGIACMQCRPGGRRIDPASRAELRGMLVGEPVTGPFARPALQRDLLRAFLVAHPAREFRLRSLDLFVQQSSS
jgi:DNA repair protein RecO (recombination protein O)